MSKAAVAVMTKTRAKYGKRLKMEDYEQMLAASSVVEVASYLRQNTHYYVSLDKFRDASEHRGNLERLLKSKLYADFAEICRFERSVGEHFYEYLLQKSDVERLITFLRHFISGHPERILQIPSDFFSDKSGIDHTKIAECGSFSELLALLDNTPYRALLAPFYIDDGQFDFTTVESVLDRYTYEQTLKMVKKNFVGEEERQLLDLIGTSAELDNIRKIYRAKAYHSIGEDTIAAQLNGITNHVDAKKIRRMLGAADEKEVLDIVRNTRYRYQMSKNEFISIDDMANRIKFAACRRYMSSSTHPAVVLLSAITVFETEIENITNIIEAKRYGVDADTVRKMLILERE